VKQKHTVHHFSPVLQFHATMKPESPSQIHSFIYSFHWHVQNITIPCHSQELLPFLSVMYFSCHPSPTTILPSFLTSSYYLFLDLPLNCVVPIFIYNTLLGILFSSLFCTCPNQRNLFNFIVSIIVRFQHLHKFLYWLIPFNFLSHCHILGLKSNTNVLHKTNT